MVLLIPFDRGELWRCAFGVERPHLSGSRIVDQNHGVAPHALRCRVNHGKPGLACYDGVKLIAPRLQDPLGGPIASGFMEVTASAGVRDMIGRVGRAFVSCARFSTGQKAAKPELRWPLSYRSFINVVASVGIMLCNTRFRSNRSARF